MEKSVNGIRGRFYYDLKKDYRERKEQSFLFRAFWAEGVRELLKKQLTPLPKKNELRSLLRVLKKQFLEVLSDAESRKEQVREAYLQLPEKPKELLRVHLPQLPEEIGQQLKEHFAQLPEELKKLLEERFPWLLEEDLQWVAYEAQIRKQLREAVRKRSGGVLQRKAPEEERERRDFWEELWLYDAGREEGLISDREYYLWLLEYLAARSACYQVYYYYHDSRKDRDENLDESIKEDGREWLYELLRAGLEKTSEPGSLSVAQIQEELKELAGRLRGPDRERPAGLLQDLKHRESMAGAFRLRAAFHENAGKSYQRVLNDFKRYCEEGDAAESRYLDPDRSPRQKIRAINRLRHPEGIPAVFGGAFGTEKPKPSRKARDDFRRTQKKIEEDRRGRV